ncbi:MAG: DnaA regulatory inactivator Hda [Gammaproteobacteria bacterium]
MAEAAPYQIPLPVSLPESRSFSNYLPGPNAEVVEHLRTLSGRGAGLAYLWGEEGCGRSHLLQAACRRAGDLGASAYFPLEELAVHGPAVIDGLDPSVSLFIDDLDAVAGDRAWESALFGLYNRARDADGLLIFSATVAPRGLGLILPDLESRLAWDLVLHLEHLDDEQCVQALRGRAGARGMRMDEATARFLLRTGPRDAHSLFAVLDHLDLASLSAQRRLTIPFLKSVLGSV